MMFGSKAKRQLAALQKEHAALIADNTEKEKRIAALTAESKGYQAANRLNRGLRMTAEKKVDALTADLAALRAISPAFLAVLDWMQDEIGVPAAQLAADATAESRHNGSAIVITPAYANAVQRALHALGWAEFGTLRSLDDNTVCGRGYWLNGNGVRARNALRVAADHLAGGDAVQAEAA